MTQLVDRIKLTIQVRTGEPSARRIQCKQLEPQNVGTIVYSSRIVHTKTRKIDNDECDKCDELRTHGGTVALLCSLAPRVENLSFSYTLGILTL